MARVLGLFAAGYCARRDRPPSLHPEADTALLTRLGASTRRNGSWMVRHICVLSYARMVNGMAKRGSPA